MKNILYSLLACCITLAITLSASLFMLFNCQQRNEKLENKVLHQQHEIDSLKNDYTEFQRQLIGECN